MRKHVFVSHSHKDLAVAESVVAALERRSIPCWIAPRDVTPGGSYAESILTAIEQASCFVLIYSAHSNVSAHVLREVERALKFGVNIIPVRLDNSAPSKSLDYLLATVHWLAIPEEAREQSIVQAAERIADWLKNFLQNPAAPLPVQRTLVTSLEPPRKRSGLLVAAAIFLALATAGAYFTGHLPFLRKPGENVGATKSEDLATSKPAIVKRPAQEGPLKANRPSGYAGTDPRSNDGAATNPENRPMPPRPDGRMENANVMYPPPPPPPPPPGGQKFGPPRRGMPPNPDGPKP